MVRRLQYWRDALLGYFLIVPLKCVSYKWFTRWSIEVNCWREWVVNGRAPCWVGFGAFTRGDSNGNTWQDMAVSREKRSWVVQSSGLLRWSVAAWRTETGGIRGDGCCEKTAQRGILAALLKLSKVPRFLAGSGGVQEIMRGEKGESVVAGSIFKM